MLSSCLQPSATRLSSGALCSAAPSRLAAQPRSLDRRQVDMAGLIKSWQKLGGLASRGPGCGGVLPAFVRSHSTVASAAAAEQPAAAPAAKVKRPTTAYARYVKENYGTIAAQHPDKKGVKELGGVIGESWAALPAAEKAKYKAAADADKAAFEKQYPDGVPKATKTSKAPKKASTRALSAYNVFVKQRLSDIKAQAGVATRDAMALVGKEWSALNQAEKDKYKPSA